MDKIKLISYDLGNTLRYEARYCLNEFNAGFNTSILEDFIIGVNSLINKESANFNSNGLELSLEGKFPKYALDELDYMFSNLRSNSGVEIKYFRDYSKEI